MSTSPYREASPQPPVELVYPARATDWATWRWPEYVILVGVVVVTFVATQSPGWLLGAGVCTSVAFIVRRGRIAQRGVVLRIDAGELHVNLLHRRPRQVALSDIEGVELDTRAIQRVERDTSVVGQLTAGTRVGMPSEESRIVLVVGEESIPLTDARTRHSEALEWAGKIRMFLRSQGWLPLSERS